MLFVLQRVNGAFLSDLGIGDKLAIMKTTELGMEFEEVFALGSMFGLEGFKL